MTYHARLPLDHAEMAWAGQLLTGGWSPVSVARYLQVRRARGLGVRVMRPGS